MAFNLLFTVHAQPVKFNQQCIIEYDDKQFKLEVTELIIRFTSNIKKKKKLIIRYLISDK